MGRLVDQDYLWLRETPTRTAGARWRRWLPFGLVPLAAVGVWYAFYTNPNIRAADDTLAATPPMPSRLASIPGAQLVPAVAYARDGGARAFAVNQIQPWSPATRTPVQSSASDEASSALSMAPAAALISDARAAGWRTLTIRPGDTLSLAFERHGLSYMDSLRIAHIPELGHFFTAGLKAGRTLQVKADGNGRVQSLVYGVDAARTVSVEREGQAFTASLAEQALDHRRTYARGVIRHSFSRDARAAGLSVAQVARVTRILSHELDFSHDLQRGDRFVVAYDALYRDGRHVGTGPILAAGLIHDGKNIRAVRYTDSQGRTDYYGADGQPLKEVFVRAPVDYTRISSPFNLNRRHPILHRIRRHEGTDYAAPEGAPIRATGAGRVVFRGRRGGYGNVVILRHDRHITMRFAHMSHFARGLSVGDRVAEGQVIGYVGMTGLATGPHVHYEFRVDGQPRNPQTVTLPGAAPMRGVALARFRKNSAPLLAALDASDKTRDIQLADASRAAR